MIPRSFNAASPGHLAYIPGGDVCTAALANQIAASVNRYTGIWQAAPALVQLEANTLEWLRDWMQFPATARGLYTTGGSMTLFKAIACAPNGNSGRDCAGVGAAQPISAFAPVLAPSCIAQVAHSDTDDSASVPVLTARNIGIGLMYSRQDLSCVPPICAQGAPRCRQCGAFSTATGDNHMLARASRWRV